MSTARTPKNELKKKNEQHEKFIPVPYVVNHLPIKQQIKFNKFLKK